MESGLGIPLALVAAMGWALAGVLARLGLRNMKVATGTSISLVSSFVFVGIFAILFDLDAFYDVGLAAVGWFALAGVTNFALGRQLNYHAISRIGASRASPIFATAPLFAIILAILFMGERINILIALGAVSVLAGLWLVTTSE